MTTLEQMVKHVLAANGSVWALDFQTIAEGLQDACNRIERLEAKVRVLEAPKS